MTKKEHSTFFDLTCSWFAKEANIIAVFPLKWMDSFYILTNQQWVNKPGIVVFGEPDNEDDKNNKIFHNVETPFGILTMLIFAKVAQPKAYYCNNNNQNTNMQKSPFRELTAQEEDEFQLKYISEMNGPRDKTFRPVWEGHIDVWATANTPTSLWYRLYNCGTNNLKILRYDPVSDHWEKILPDQIHNLHGLLWILTWTLDRKE